ncbi:MAG: dihydrolipoyl dehydrogenase, partial [Candidatus Binatia bacterium]
AKAVLGAELDLQLATEAVTAHDGAGFVIRWHDTQGNARAERFAALLSATGRAPNLQDLGLEQAGFADAGGPPAVDPQTMQLGEAPIFLAGDVSNDRPLLHEAADEGRIAGGNAAAYPHVRAYARRVPLSIAFTDPNLAVVGTPFALLERDAAQIGCVSYEDQGRARVMGRNAGLVRIYAEREGGRLLGAEMFGPRVEHTAHLLAWAVQARLTVEEALAMPFYHPVIEEGIRTALQDLAARLELRPAVRPGDLECGPGV